MTPLLEVDRVSVRYGDTLVLDGVSLAVSRGEFLGIIGPNGSGKTTLLRVMLGLLRPTSGAVRLFGQPLASFRDWRRLGYMPQRTSFDGALPVTAAEAVATGLVSRLGFRRRTGPDERRKVTESLALVGMEKHARARMGALSTGQQQRVLIARALVSDPELLLLDEPTASIDVEAQSSFYTLLRSFNRERGVTLVIVSHDIGVVAQEVSRVACLNRHLLSCGHPSEVLTQEALSTLYGSSVRLVPHTAMLPEFLEYGFMQRAFAVGIVTALICPAIGVFLIPRRLSLIADTLAHVALAGVALGLLLGALAGPGRPRRHGRRRHRHRAAAGARRRCRATPRSPCSCPAALPSRWSSSAWRAASTPTSSRSSSAAS